MTPISVLPLPPDDLADGPDLALEVPAVPENVAMVRQAVQRLIENREISEEQRGDIILAVGEACANAVMHAYEGRPVGPVGVSGTFAGPMLCVVVADHGNGIAPRHDSPGLGLGLPLIASLTSSLELRPSPAGGTEVWMCFDLGAGERRRGGPRFQHLS